MVSGQSDSWKYYDYGKFYPMYRWWMVRFWEVELPFGCFYHQKCSFTFLIHSFMHAGKKLFLHTSLATFWRWQKSVGSRYTAISDKLLRLVTRLLIDVHVLVIDYWSNFYNPIRPNMRRYLKSLEHWWSYLSLIGWNESRSPHNLHGE